MRRKIFISYKYGDRDVKALPGILSKEAKVRDYVDWLEKKFKERTEHYFKAESNNEDLSGYTEEYIWERLKDRIYDSSITIVLVSPNFKEPHKWEKSQWIPWELAYSVRVTKRKDRTSQRNAVLAVILPDKNGSYNYYSQDKVFKILKENIKNGYIPVVGWDDFKYNCDKYIDKAYKAKEEIPEYKIVKSI